MFVCRFAWNQGQSSTYTRGERGGCNAQAKAPVAACGPLVVNQLLPENPSLLTSRKGKLKAKGDMHAIERVENLLLVLALVPEKPKLDVTEVLFGGPSYFFLLVSETSSYFSEGTYTHSCLFSSLS